MFPEQYKNTLLRLADSDEDMKTLLGLFHLLEGYTTDETLAKNFRAITGKDCTDLLKELRRREILKIGAFNEYLCLSGYESIFDEVAARYAPQPADLSHYLENAIEEQNQAALKMTELLLKVGKLGTLGFTQYGLIKSYISDLYSSATFESLEAGLLKERLCVYGKRRDHEFLVLHQPEDAKKAVEKQLKAWKQEHFPELPVIKRLETVIAELRAEAKRRIQPYSAKMAEQAGMKVEELEETVSAFTGFDIGDTSLLITGTVLVDKDTLYLVVTDSLSEYDVREWKDFPAVFVLDRLPKWLGKLGGVFRDAYPKLEDRKIALVVPNEVAYANYRRELLSNLVRRLGIDEVKDLPGAPKAREYGRRA